MIQHAYCNATCKDMRAFHEVIMAAVNNGGVFDEDFADIFVLRPTPDGSLSKYVLDFA